MSNTTQLTIKTTAKWAAIGWLSYVLLTIIATAVITADWMSGRDLTGLTQIQIGQMMDQDVQVSIMTSIVAALSAMVLAYWLTHKTSLSGYRTALAFAAGLALYGIAGIILHPEHLIIHQLLKLIAPFLTCGLGAWFALKNK